MCRRLLCSAVILMCITGAGLAQDYDIEIPRTAIPPVIDGQYDGAYSLSEVHYFTTIDAPTLAPADCSGHWQVLWDTQNIYLIVDVTDDALFGDSGTWQDDAAEFYFDGGNSKGPGYPLSEDDRQYTFLYNQNIVTGTNVNTEGVEYASVVTATGWRMEAKLPWISLQDAAPQLGDLIGIDCFINDDDDGGATREHQIGTFSPDGGSWQVPANWGIAILTKGSPAYAFGPQPAADSTDVRQNTLLSWEPGIYAGTHNVYFGENFDDVTSATVPVIAGQDANSFDAGRLEFGTTYFWRVDEVNATPDKTVYTGEVWNFTMEPYSLQIPGDAIIATASSDSGNNAPAMTVNGSGLTGNTHTTNEEQMWLSAPGDLSPWLMYEFDAVQKLDKMLIWNSNSNSEAFIGWGIKDVNVETSLDGVVWTGPADSIQISRAPGLDTYHDPHVLDLGTVVARYVRLNILNNWGGLIKQYGVSEVQFYGLPVFARTPNPASGSMDVLPNTMVAWRAGREANQHTLYISTDENAVANGTALSVTSSVISLDLTSLDLHLGETYYWRVDEVNEAESTPVWAGPVWRFTTPAALIVDDFEGYRNLSPNRPFQTWLDGYGYSADEFFPVAYAGNGTGSGVGHDIWSPSSPYFGGSVMETVNTMAGIGQSMPFYYNNSSGASTIERTFAEPQDWTLGGIKTLSILFSGQAGNTGTLFMMINNTKFTYTRDNDNISRGLWQAWNVDVASENINLSNVTRIQLGVEGVGASGLILFDDITLHAAAGELIATKDPGSDGLVAKYTFEGNMNDSSGNGHHGTVIGTGGTQIVSDPVRGQVLSLPGGDDQYVAVGAVGISGTMPRTIACWAKAANTDIPDWTLIFGFTGQADGTGGNGSHFNIGSLGGPGGIGAHCWGWEETMVSDDEGLNWHHYAMTYDGTTIDYFVDGVAMDSDTATSNVQDLSTSGDRVHIGSRITQTSSFPGNVDDAVIYNRVLSADEILFLAGFTQPIDKPF